ncbi:hypothetical protein KP509_03G017700 [Ceratopteris richardii]|uniref:Uncharacterized protein n=1 Tax=Ceratopteris richardii TaxID=49495 RepID=A0A8T2V1X9_CERRI|nr:hypothetical protein KP509_03G017700 [Ceratopteris richardii]
MAPGNVSAKLYSVWKNRRLTAANACKDSVSQVFSASLCRTPVPYLRVSYAGVPFYGRNNAELQPIGTFANDTSSEHLSKHGRVHSLTCNNTHLCMPQTRWTSNRYWHPFTVDVNQLVLNTAIITSGLQSYLFCCSRTLTGITAQTTVEAQSQNCCRMKDSNTHIDETINNVDNRTKAPGEERFPEIVDHGNKQTVQEEALRNFEALLDQMEKSDGAHDHRIGTICLRLAQLCDTGDIDPSRILSYGQRALRAYKSFPLSWEHVTCLHVIGHAYFRMGKFDSAIEHLEESASILNRSKLAVKVKDIDTLSQARESLLGQAKRSLGKFHDALPHFKRSIESAERVLEPGNPELGSAYFQAAQAYKEAKDPEEAICLCIKAVDNHANYYGPKSSQAAEIRKFMSMIYFDLREFENALLEHKVVRPIFESLGRSEDMASSDLIVVESLLELQRYDESIAMLKGIVSSVPETSPFHGNALVMLGKTYAIVKDHQNAMEYCTMALHALEKQQLSIDTGSSLVHLALVYQRQHEIELATTTYKKALSTFNQCSGYQAHTAAADVEGQIGFLLLHSEKVEEALPFLESSVSKKSDIHGADSVELLDVHNHLGVAYSEEGKLDEALKQFEAAKLILSKNATEVDSLMISIYSNLSNMYSVFGRCVVSHSSSIHMYISSLSHE